MKWKALKRGASKREALKHGWSKRGPVQSARPRRFNGSTPQPFNAPPLRSSTLRRSRPVLITGGAGFIGTNLAHRFLPADQPVLVFDNLSRPGVERNLQWLRETHGDLLRVQVG